MAQINAYLKFDGNCREAMTFYKECFGGELTLNTVKGSPLEGYMKPEDGDKILHSSLISDKLVLFASEMTKPTTVGDAIFLWINTSGDEETKAIFSKLSRDGNVTAELQPAYWGTQFASVTDKYGLNWYISSL